MAAFFTAIVVALIAVPRLRRLALATGFVDLPDPRKIHRDPVPYLGGVAVIVAVLAGLAFETRLAREGAALVVVAALLGSIGLLDDDRHVSPYLRLLGQLAAAAMAVTVGVRIHASGSEIVDIAITLVWIIGVTNAFNFMDNMDGLAAGIAAVTSAAVFVIAVLAGQPLVATLAAATSGACLGFLVYNRPPASIFMGDAGSLFLGFVLAVLTVDVSPELAPPFSFVIPVILLALPVLDTTTVTLSRMRRGQSVTVGGKDHLSHRLVALGLSRGRAVAILVAIETALGVLAVLAVRRVVPLWFAVLLTSATLAVLTLVTTRAEVYTQPVTGIPRKARLAVLGGILALPIAAAPAVLALGLAADPARDARAVAQDALAALDAGDGPRALAGFKRAEQLFSTARARLSGPLPAIGLVVPGLSSNLGAAKTMVAIGEDLSEAGARLGALSDPARLPVQSGAVSIDEVRRLAPTLSDAAEILTDAHRRLQDIEPAFLVPPLHRAVNELAQELSGKQTAAVRAAEAARLLPAMLGADGTRRYFVAFQNNAELRGTGGFIGNFAELVATDGQLRLERFGRLNELQAATMATTPVQLPSGFARRWNQFTVSTQWQQVNVSPDFPTTARVIGLMYPNSGGNPIDGVIAIDPVGLAALLELTGPVPVAGWHEPISKDNVVDVTLRDAYSRFPLEENLDSERIQFLGDVARTVTEAFTTLDLRSGPQVVGALSKASRGGHLMVHLNDPVEEQLISNLGADGKVPPLRGDSLMVVNQNASANKLDYYLQRQVRYDIRLDPSGERAKVSGKVDVTLSNAVPPLSDLSWAVIGPYNERFRAGENRTYVSVYSPFLNGPSTLDGEPLDVDSHPDLGRRSKSAFLSLDAGDTKTITMGIEGQAKLAEGGWYRLDLLRQPTLNRDQIDLSIAVPKGWRIAEARGVQVDGRRATGDLELDVAQTVWLRVEPTGLNRVWERLFRGD